MRRIIVAVAVGSGLALTASQAWAADPFKGCADRMRAMKPRTPDQDLNYRTAFLSCMGQKAPEPAGAITPPKLTDKPGTVSAVGPALPIPLHPKRIDTVPIAAAPSATISN